ncbi:MAG: hypothetical protein ACXVCY_02055 [Pseudobdellovibrionaceae bacterium]
MMINEKDIEYYITELKAKVGLSSYSYAQIIFLIKQSEPGKNEGSLQQFINLNLLMALFYYKSGSMVTYKKYFDTAAENAKKIKYQFEFIIDSLSLATINSEPKMAGSDTFSKVELNLLEVLKKCQKLDKHSLIELLYGPSVDFFTAENRLKNLIFRIRKKKKSLVVFKDGYFSLGLDDSFLQS